MSIINRYLRREILLPFFYSLLVIIFILLLGNLFKIVSMVVSEGVKLWDVIRLVTAMIPQMMTMALPLAFFFAVLAGIGRLVGDGEITALEAAGISPYQILQPILQLAPGGYARCDELPLPSCGTKLRWHCAPGFSTWPSRV